MYKSLSHRTHEKCEFSETLESTALLELCYLVCTARTGLVYKFIHPDHSHNDVWKTRVFLLAKFTDN